MASDTARDPRTAAGLACASGPIPLLGVQVEARLQGFAAEVTITQRYRNDEPHPVEAVYVFPLDEAAAVCGFEAWVDGVHVVGEVKEKDAAFAAYDNALSAGHGAFLLDEERPDVFTASVGNLPPGREALLRIRYVAELGAEGDAVRFVLPTTVSPRYAPAPDRRGVGRTPAESVNPPRAWSVPYGLSLDVTLDMPSAIRAVSSPSHPLEVETDGTRGRVRLGVAQTALDRDVVLLVRLADPARPEVRGERTAGGETAVLLSFVPRFEGAEAAAEVVFLVDRSGSMGGTSIEEARRALQLGLRSLTAGCRFNIVGFGDTHVSLFPQSRAYDDAALAEASRHVAGLDADLGGTELVPALESILAHAPAAGLARQLLVLTDGQVSNSEAVVALVRHHAETTRVFTFGIGHGASHALVRGMARAGGGAAEFIAPGERMEPKVLRQLGRALFPALTNLRVDWGGLAVRQAPFRIPAVFSGGRVLVYGIVDGLRRTEAILRADSAHGPLAFPVTFDPAAIRDGTLIATLAARAMLRDLVDGTSALHDRRGSRQDRGRDRVTSEMVRLGTTYGLVSPHTSFVAIEHREAPFSGQAALRRIPIALTHGWGASDEPAPARSAASAPDLGPEVQFAGRVLMQDVTIGVIRESRRTLEPSEPAMDRVVACEAMKRPAGLEGLVHLQRADGSWALDDALATVLRRDVAHLRAALPPGAGRSAEATRAWATALALAWLEDHAADARVEWALLARKAQRWLDGCGIAAPPKGWMEAARRALA